MKTTAVTGGFLFFTINSKVTLEKDQFWDGVSNQGGAVYLQGGSLNATSCEFKDNYSADLGGAVYLSGYEGVLIDDCTF